MPTDLAMSATARRCTSANAPAPAISNLAKEVWSTSATPSRTARCSAPTCSNQFGRANEGRSTGSTPGGANHSGRSHPPREPITAPRETSVSWNGLRRMPRALSFSEPGGESL